jgi:hypothetical protein
MKEKCIYIAETSLEFTGEKYYEEIIETQITDLDTIVSLGRGTELVFVNEKLSKIYEYYEEQHEVYRKQRIINETEINYKEPHYPQKSILRYEENVGGFHQLGGDFSEEFVEPAHNLSVPFQYIGYINNLDPNFEWIPNKLHLMFPIYLGVEEVYLDYSDCKNPKIVNIEELSKCNSSLEEVNKDSKIKKKKKKFNFIKSNDYSLYANSGIANWMQGQYVPKCPITGKKMKFICQIYKGTETEHCNIIPNDDWNKNYFKNMSFFGSDLYIFFEPTSKIACYFTQGI